MARCIRNGVSYKRHRFKDRTQCEACGVFKRLAIRKPVNARARAKEKQGKAEEFS